MAFFSSCADTNWVDANKSANMDAIIFISYIT
jgi:hypothetical protein